MLLSLLLISTAVAAANSCFFSVIMTVWRFSGASGAALGMGEMGKRKETSTNNYLEVSTRKNS